MSTERIPLPKTTVTAASKAFKQYISLCAAVERIKTPWLSMVAPDKKDNRIMVSAAKEHVVQAANFMNKRSMQEFLGYKVALIVQ